MIIFLLLLVAVIFPPQLHAQVIVSWAYLPGQEVQEDGTDVERASPNTEDWQVIAVALANVTEVEDPVGDTGHRYRARAFIGAEYFPYSNIAAVPPLADTTRPTVQITSPANNAVVPRRSNVTIQSSFSDNVGVVSVRYIVGMTVLNCPALATSCVWPVPNPPDRAYTIIVEARDQAGNVGSAQVSVRSSR